MELFELGAALCFIAIVMSLVFLGLNYQCKTIAEKMEKEVSYGPIQGCMIRHNNQWIPLDRFRVIE
jgi:hypothetical protein